MTDVNEEMAIQYAMARRQFPTVAAEQIIETMIQRMGEEGTLSLAAASLVSGDLAASAQAMAKQYIRDFVYEMEGPASDSI
ncbi:MAG: hypothetical protein M3Z25_19395 [Actinomycetota bacterium]|nr:hypothetical protein [Actinomycetota bacterium]